MNKAPPSNLDAESRPNIHWLWKISCVAVSLFFMGLGALALIQKQHVGTARFRPSPVVLTGSNAEAMGLILIIMGLLPLVVFVPSRKWGARFAIAWGVCLVVAIFAAVVFAKQ